MKAALIGYGQMGKMIERLAPDFGIEIVEKYWDEHPFSETGKIDEALENVEVLIDFSVPDAAFKNIQTGLIRGKQFVIGTTGWFDRLEEVKKLVRETGTGLVYASNFSLGVNLFYKLVKKSSEIVSRFKEYDPMVQELHHQFKKDAPSGTALEIVKLMETDYPEQKIPVSSVRGGYIPGTHIITYDSKVDSIQLSHCIRNREGLAKGALLAANWIQGKTGIYHFSEILDNILQ